MPLAHFVEKHLGIVPAWKTAGIPRSLMVRKYLPGEAYVVTKTKTTRVKDFGELLLLLTQDEPGLEEYVYPRLRLGDAWWIPDEITGFSQKQRHPWVVVRGYSPRLASVVACPRTTDIRCIQRGIVTPADILPGLDQDGLFLLRFRQSFVARDFCYYEYIGRLPENLIRRILDFYGTLAKGETR